MKPCHENNGAAIFVERSRDRDRGRDRDRALSLVLTFTLQLNILTGTLVSCFSTSQNLLWSVHCKGQKY